MLSYIIGALVLALCAFLVDRRMLRRDNEKLREDLLDAHAEIVRHQMRARSIDDLIADANKRYIDQDK